MGLCAKQIEVFFEKRAIKFSCQGDKGGKKNFCDTFFYASFRRICRGN